MNTAKELAMCFEGLRLKVYLDPVGLATIGFGHRCEPTHPPITEAEAIALLDADLIIARNSAHLLCPEAVGGTLEALTDFCLNLGASRLEHSTLRTAVNRKDWLAAKQQINRWVYAGNQILQGLVHRRAAEAELLG